MCKGSLLCLPHRSPEAAGDRGGVGDKNLVLSREIRCGGPETVESTQASLQLWAVSLRQHLGVKKATMSHLLHRLPLVRGGGLALEDPRALPSFSGVCD